MKINSKITAFLLAGCIGCAFPVSAAEYMDIYEEDTAFAVSVLDALDVVEGFPDGGYHPEDTLTRAQFCKMAVILLGMGDKAGSAYQKTLFSDVTSAHWAASYINLAYENGIIEGYGNGQFGPDDTLTYAQVLTIMLRMLGYADTDIGTRYPDDQMRTAGNIGLTEQVWLNAGDFVTRGDAARLLLTLLETETKSGSPYYKTIAARSAEEIVLLDNSDTSSSGKSDCVKVYENGQNVWYQKSDEYADGVVGAEGTALLDENGKILVFLPNGTEYSLIDGILLANNQRSDNDAIPYEIVLYDPWMEESDTYLRTNSISANLVGSTGTLLVDEYGYAVSFLSADTDSYTLVRNAVLLDAYNEDDTAVFYINGKETSYELSYSSSVYESYEGYTGTILTDDDEEIYAFVPEEKEYSIEYGILMSSDNDEAVFLINDYMEELAITGTISSSLAGYAGTVLINDDGEAVAFLGTEKYGNITENAVLLDHNSISDTGTKNCALFYVNGKKVWYEQSYRLSSSLSGCSGTLLCDEDGVIIDFYLDGDEYTIGYALLLECSSSKAKFYLDGETVELRLDASISSNSAGSYGYLLLNHNGRVEAFIEDNDAEEEYPLTKQGILLDSCATAADHRTETVKIYIDGNIMTYLANDIDSDYEGLCGRLLLDEDECAREFLEDDTYCDTVRGEQVTDSYRVKDNIPVIYYDNQSEEWCKTTWGNHKENLTESDDVVIYFDSLGDIDVLIVR